MKIGVVGAGIAGLSAAWLLHHNGHEVTLFEKEPRFGGHANTVDARFPDGHAIAVDTGFIVYNERNYPHLTALFKHFGVETIDSDMSFAASLRGGAFEYGTQTLNQVFGQRTNLINPAFYGLIRQIKRFFHDSLSILNKPTSYTLKQYVHDEKYSNDFIHNFLIPMGAAIWSTPDRKILDFPASSFVNFFKNHGLLSTSGQPQWRTVKGGSREYVKKIIAALPNCQHHTAIAAVQPEKHHVLLVDHKGDQHTVDAVVMACHADETYTLLKNKSEQEHALLSPFSYQSNEAILHSDTTLMPKRERIWSSWNYLGSGNDGVAVTYWMNKLQQLDKKYPLFVTLNPSLPINESLIHKRMTYTHPLFTSAAMNAQKDLSQLQGQRNAWYCGSYFGYGFHEDALKSSVDMVQRMGGRIPWL